MTPTTTINNCDLYHGDIRDILPALGLCADMVLTDAPYKLTAGGSARIGQWQVAKDYNNNGNIVTCDLDWPDFLPLIYAAQRQGHAYFMANNRHIANCENAALRAGYGLHNWLAWNKRTLTPNKWYMKNLEFIGMFYKSPDKYINDCSMGQLVEMAQVDVSGQFSVDGKSHPTEKPIALMEHYIRMSSQPGDVVLDPFMGSGTTGVAAARLGRKFIGIELERKWFDVACERMSMAMEQPSLCFT